MSIHYLKTWPQYYEAIENGQKKAESRRNDRNFQVGDTLVLCEYDPSTSEFSGREKTFRISFVLEGEEFGVLDGWAHLSLEPLEPVNTVATRVSEVPIDFQVDVTILPKLEKEIEPGDIVTLKSGGPKMVVEEIWTDNTVECLWFPRGDDSMIESRRISSIALEHVN